MDTLTCMRAFSAVVEQGSFTKAAGHLGIAKALVSKYVSQLESHLGTRLLNRTTRTVSVTEAGRIYHERSRQILEDMVALELSVQEDDAAPRGKLRITAASAFGDMYLPEIIGDFLDRQPLIDIELTLTDRFVNIVEEGYDLALRIGEMEDTSLIARKLGAMRIVTCASPEYIALKGMPDHPEDLKEHACLLDTNMRVTGRWPFQEGKKKLNVPVRGQFQVNSTRIVRDLAIKGKGIGRCPAYVVRNDLIAGRLKILLEEYEIVEQGLYAVYPHRAYLASKIRTFVDFLQSGFKQDPPWRLE